MHFRHFARSYRTWARVALTLAAGSLGPILERASAQCTPHWQPFVPGGIGNASVYALCSVSQGSGSPIVYAGGDFTSVGALAANGIARWDGSQWSALGSGVGGVQFPTVYSMAMFDDDGAGPHPPALYVGGNFTTAGGVSANYIAKWDGSSWSAVGAGMDSWVRALTVFDDDGPGPHPPALCAAGFFQHAGGAPASCVARWDGTSWSTLGSGVTSSPNLAIWAMTLFDDDGAGPHPTSLVVGGNFSLAGGTSASNIARWDGSSWSALGSGVDGNPGNDVVMSLAVADAGGTGIALYAGGLFTRADGSPANYVACWNGSSWSPLGSGTNNGVTTLIGFDDDGPGPHAQALYVGGSFGIAGGSNIPLFAKWDGASWTAVGGGMGQGMPDSSIVVDFDGAGSAPPRLVVGGSMTNVGAMTSTTSNRLGLAAWNGSDWGAIGGGILEGPNGGWPNSMAVFDEDGVGPGRPSLFVGGQEFETAGGVAVQHHIARWDGWSWSPVGAGFNSTQPEAVFVVKTLDEDGPGPMPPALYVGGVFRDPTLGIFGLAKWDGSSWSGFSGGPSGGIYDVAVFDEDGPGPNPPALFAGGDSGVFKWNGATWTQPGGGVSGWCSCRPAVYTLAVFDDDGPGPHPPALYAGGTITSAGGVAASSVAKWDGTAWSALGTGLTNASGQPTCVTLSVVDEDGSGPGIAWLFAGGDFTVAGGASVQGTARWNGSTWSSVGAPTFFPECSAVFDADGTGAGTPQLYAGVARAAFNSQDLGIESWNGSSWVTLGGGVDWNVIGGPSVTTLAVFDEDDTGSTPPAIYVGGFFETAGGLPSHRLARFVTCSTPITSFCPGDGTGGNCPCNNFGGPGRGCANSANGAGAVLTASGGTGVLGDSLVLTSSGELPSALSVFLQGTTPISPVAYGDGLRCVGGTLKRLYARNAAGGVVRAPLASDPRVTTRSGAVGSPILAGQVRQYQVFYRDPVSSFCVFGNTFNISSGLQVAWGP